MAPFLARPSRSADQQAASAPLPSPCQARDGRRRTAGCADRRCRAPSGCQDMRCCTCDIPNTIRAAKLRTIWPTGGDIVAPRREPHISVRPDDPQPIRRRTRSRHGPRQRRKTRGQLRAGRRIREDGEPWRRSWLGRLAGQINRRPALPCPRLAGRVVAGDGQRAVADTRCRAPSGCRTCDAAPATPPARSGPRNCAPSGRSDCA